MDEPMSFAVLLRGYRAAARLTQEELAERSGVSARAITDLERGVRRFPYPDTVDRLAEALNLRAADRERLRRARRPRDADARRQRVEPLEPLPAQPANVARDPDLRIDGGAQPIGEPATVRAQTPAGGTRGEERKLVTVVFGELVDSSASARELDPEDTRDLLSRYQIRIRADLERFGGTLEKFIGNQLVAFFGAPTAHEDDPERAVRAALAVRDWVVDENDGVRARIGVASGEALVMSGALASAAAPIAIGEVVNIASGLRLSAPLDGVFVDEQTFRRTKDTVQYRGAETPTVTGPGWPGGMREAIRPLVHPGIDPLRHRAPFIGRERELGALRERLAWAASDMAPQ